MDHAQRQITVLDVSVCALEEQVEIGSHEMSPWDAVLSGNSCRMRVLDHIDAYVCAHLPGLRRMLEWR